jgi:hypothetical protein
MGPDHDGPAPRRRSVRYPPDDRPPIQVLHDGGDWWPGALHAWLPVGDSDWSAIAVYRVGGLQYYRQLPAASVRPAP